ncbi:MAG TPA: ABC transporter permease [Candidatus Limnocylindrales bacterium]|nr:ABC transporter permease [Candidatus Limnocylindrales bacterium]
MLAYIVRRVLQALPVLFLIAVLSFGLMQLAPGGPHQQFQQNPRMTDEMVNRYLARWCLERNPDALGMLRSFGGWFGVWNCDAGGFLSEQGMPNFLPNFLGGGDNGVIHGDFGLSMTVSPNRPVIDLITERIPATAILMLTAFTIWVTLAIILGVIAAVRRYSVFDQSITLMSYIFYSLPTFWLGLMLIYLFAVNLGVLPSSGMLSVRTAPAPFNTPRFWEVFWENPLPLVQDIARHLVLPVITLVAVSVAADTRYVRSAMLDVLGQDYVRTARAKGLPPSRVVFRHAFRNALLPIITNVALALAFLFSGAIVTETIFAWPGMGRLYFEAIQARDYFLVMGVLFVGSLLVVMMNLLADVLYAWADPRIRY